MELKPMNVVAGITAALALFAGVIAFDTRYTKQAEFTHSMEEMKEMVETAKTDIIDEMRQEVVKNRTVMINAMQREADDLEFRMMELEQDGKPVPRYMSDKFKQINRQIEALNENTTD